jgi:glyoxylase-like metal-dependent hydrolase (beta-lactamase superfamily II)
LSEALIRFCKGEPEVAVEHIKHWRVGEVEVVRIVEIDAFEDDIGMLLEGETAAFVRQFPWLQPQFATPDGRMKISFQCFALRSQGRSVMIDTCIGAGRKREYDVFSNLRSTFLDDLAFAGYPRERIDTVLCTHMHFDHVGWNTMQVNGTWVPTFPRARYLFSRAEYEYWVRLQEDGASHHFEHLKDSVEPVLAAGLVDFVPADHAITDEVSLFPTPGHTPGHVSILIRSGGQEAVITGDMMHHPIQLVVPTHPGHFDEDKEQGGLTRKAFVDRFANTKTLVIGSHFCDPTSGWIVREAGHCKLTLE